MVKTSREDVTATAGEVLGEGDRITVKLAGRKLASVTMAAGSTRAKVTDEDKLTAWVAENHPSEVETVTRIRPAYLEQLKKQAKQDGVAADPDTGDLLPGIEVTTGDPSLRVLPADGARDLLIEAWRSGELNLGEVLQIPSGGEQT